MRLTIVAGLAILILGLFVAAFVFRVERARNILRFMRTVAYVYIIVIVVVAIIEWRRRGL